MHIFLLPALIFWWEGVGAQEGGDHIHMVVFAQLAGDPEQLEFGGGFQPVARLYLHRSNPFLSQGVETATSLVEQFGLAGLTAGLNRADNAATGTGDFFIAGALETQLELVGAVTGKHQMGMGIYQPGRQPAAFAFVNRSCQHVEGRQFATLANPGYFTIFYCQAASVMAP